MAWASACRIETRLEASRFEIKAKSVETSLDAADTSVHATVAGAHKRRGALRACVKIQFMAIPNVRRFRITSPDGGQSATVMAVLPRGADVDAYVADAAKRYDWKGHAEAQAKQFKIRVGQQKQKKAK